MLAEAPGNWTQATYKLNQPQKASKEIHNIANRLVALSPLITVVPHSAQSRELGQLALETLHALAVDESLGQAVVHDDEYIYGILVQ